VVDPHAVTEAATPESSVMPTDLTGTRILRGIDVSAAGATSHDSTATTFLLYRQRRRMVTHARVDET
jgi:hypothetical protein